MPVDIRNRADQIVQLRLNSNATHNLGPGEILPDVAEADIAGNSRVERLRTEGLIEVGPAQPPPPRSTDMRADEAIEHIRRAPRAELGTFVPEDETRVSVRRALEERDAE